MQKFCCKWYIFTSSPQSSVIIELGFRVLYVVRICKSLMYIRKSNGLTTEPCVTPAMGLILSDKKPSKLTWITRPTRISDSQCGILMERSSTKILYQSSLHLTLSKAFSMSKNGANTCSLLLKLSVTDWESAKRWSSVNLACLKSDWYLFMKPMSSR